MLAGHLTNDFMKMVPRWRSPGDLGNGHKIRLFALKKKEKASFQKHDEAREEVSCPSKFNLLPLKPISSLPTSPLRLPAHINLCFLFASNNTTDGICQGPSRLSATQTLDVNPSLTGSMWRGPRMGGHQREDSTVGHQNRGPRRVQRMWLPLQGSWYCRALQRSHGPNQGGPEPHHPEPHISSHKP